MLSTKLGESCGYLVSFNSSALTVLVAHSLFVIGPKINRETSHGTVHTGAMGVLQLFLSIFNVGLTGHLPYINRAAMHLPFCAAMSCRLFVFLSLILVVMIMPPYLASCILGIFSRSPPHPPCALPFHSLTQWSNHG